MLANVQSGNRLGLVRPYVAAILLCVTGCGPHQPRTVHAGEAQPAPSTLKQYREQVKPILQSNCLRCHGGMNHRGGLNMDTRAGLLQGGKSGPAITPGHFETSLLVHLVADLPESDPMHMPRKGTLSPAEIESLKRWVSEGAPMDP